VTEGDLVVLDFGALVDGYHSDMTRTVMVGRPTTTQARMYEVVRDAQAAGVAAVKDGAEARAVDEACRSIIRDAGWGDAFVHGTGHGVGLDIHEPPRVSTATDAKLAAATSSRSSPACTSPSTAGSG
jgi:Xaa-Pro aminopeptidase